MKTFVYSAFVFLATVARAADPLPSWNDTAPKKATNAFVEKVTKEGSPDFVPPAKRIAGFCGDRTDHTLHAESATSHAKAAQLHAEAAAAYAAVARRERGGTRPHARQEMSCK